MAEVGASINGEAVTVDVEPEMPLLWVLRDLLGLTGTKFGCGEGWCGSCTVHVGGEATRSCITALAAVEGLEVTTIEGLSMDGSHPLQLAFVQENVAQCGYCQPGQIMAASALLAQHPQPTDDQITEAMKSVLCRCGTYMAIRRAIERAAGIA